MGLIDRREPPPHPRRDPSEHSTERSIDREDDPEPESDPAPRLGRGQILHGRYELIERLGRGSQGEVWAALDALSGSQIAFKLFRVREPIDTVRVRREIAALHLLRIPGVVRVLDEGVYEGKPFVVMERVTGLPFPGRAIPASWSEIAETTASLLETLREVHAAGVIHRDLKPSNILVDETGRPVVLDFGLALGAPIGSGLTQMGMLLGTPAYLAPEQILGGVVGPESDLYAVGAMLYEALSGRPPHDSDDVETMLHRRLTEAPQPLRRGAPHAPSLVSEVLAMLLRRNAAERPSSATEVLRLLRGAAGAGTAKDTMAALGDRPLVSALVDAALAGTPYDVVGPHGSGKTYCLHRAAQEISRRGRRVIECPAGERPFDSLAPLPFDLAVDRLASLSRVTATAETELRRVLSEGAVIVCDDAERMDPWSASVIERCRGSGAVLRALSTDPAGAADSVGLARIAPFSTGELERLFAGDNRLFHVREDAAAELWERTGGHAGSVAEQLVTWLRIGIARREDDRFVLDRDTLDRLRADGRARDVRAPTWSGSAEMNGASRDLLAWVSVAWPDSTPSLVAAAMGDALWRVEAEFASLAERGLLRCLSDGRAQPLAPPTARSVWGPERRRAAHRAVAAVLPAGARSRFFHLALGVGPESSDSELLDLAREANERARALALHGALGEAVATLDEALRVVRAHARLGRPDGETALLSSWVVIALESGTPHALDRALYEVSRSELDTPAVGRLEALLRAGLDAQAGPALPALERMEAIGPLADPELSRRLQTLRALVARRCPLDKHESILEDLTAWAAGAADIESRARLRSFRGRWYYRTAHFVEAAEEHFAAAAATRWTTTRIAEMLSAASACMEAFRLERAADAARVALELSVRCRDPYLEARAEWLTRCIDYRLGQAMSVDAEFVQAVARLGLPDMEALVCLQEGTIAWRSGEMTRATDLCGRARRTWVTLGKPWGVLLSRAIMLAAGDAMEPSELEALLERALACPIPGVGAQALGLMAAREGPTSRWRDAARRLAAQVPERDWPHRLDAMSVAEALRYVMTG